MIGGPTDVVVEPNIVRSMPQRDQAPQRSPVGTELPSPPRLAPEPGWAEPEPTRADNFEHREPAMPEIPQRPARAPFADDVRRPAPAAERHADPIPNFTPEPMVRPEPTLRAEPSVRPAPRSERMEPMIPRGPRSAELAPKAPPPPPRAPRPMESPLSSADQNLAEMAQRLEAALRRPGGDQRHETSEPRTPSVSPVDRVGAPPAAPEPALRPSRELGARNSSSPSPQPDAPAEPAPKAPFENLEDEMASLLGRPKPPA
jgi:hypothetical protein